MAESKFDQLTDQELADALQGAIRQARALAFHAEARACRYADKSAAVGPVVPDLAGVVSALALAHMHATSAGLKMPGVTPRFGDK